MFISPTYIQKSIFLRLKIKSYSKCDTLHNSCQNYIKNNKLRNELSYQYKFDRKKFCSLVSIEYLKQNGAII